MAVVDDGDGLIIRGGRVRVRVRVRWYVRTPRRQTLTEEYHEGGNDVNSGGKEQ